LLESELVYTNHESWPFEHALFTLTPLFLVH